jgi:FkbM family methyltransferase
MAEHTAMISIAGRLLTLAGAHPAYLATIDGTVGEATRIGRLMTDLPSGAHCLDVGANIGLTTLIMAAIRPDCRVTAFEPVPENVGFLRRNIAAAGLSNVTIVEAAVSDRRGELAMTSNGPWSLARTDGEVRCETVLLDDYADPNVRLVKIDVEGHEPEVLRGAAGLLRGNRPLVFLEFNAWTLALQHCDLLGFAETLWARFDVLETCHGEAAELAPDTAIGMLYRNMLQHGCLLDLLMRPKHDHRSAEAV